LQLPPAAREQVTIALAPIDADDAQLAPLDQELPEYAKRQPDCRALMRHYGIWPLTSITILAVLGDARRFSSSREAVRYAALDITVQPSDARRALGRRRDRAPGSEEVRPPSRETARGRARRLALHDCELGPHHPAHKRRSDPPVAPKRPS
jgi:transposase